MHLQSLFNPASPFPSIVKATSGPPKQAASATEVSPFSPPKKCSNLEPDTFFPKFARNPQPRSQTSTSTKRRGQNTLRIYSFLPSLIRRDPVQFLAIKVPQKLPTFFSCADQSPCGNAVACL